VREKIGKTRGTTLGHYKSRGYRIYITKLNKYVRTTSVPYQIKPLSSRLELILIKSSQADLKSIQAETKSDQAGLV
jgi:hypothetical protein